MPFDPFKLDPSMTARTDNEFKIKFDGQLNQVDAQTFINSLINVSTIIQEVNEELGSTGKIEVKIKSNEPGSFITSLLLETQELAQQQLTKENVILAATVVSGLAALFDIKKHLGGKSPKSEEVVQEKDEELISIENEKGVTKIYKSTYYSIYKRNQVVNDAISNNFNTLENDPSVTGFEVIDHESNVVFEASKDEFDQLATKSAVEDESKKNKLVVANVVIHKIVFADRYKWEFYYQGNKISAQIEDEDFFARIERGEESFSKGDSLKVELEITQIYDPSVDIFVNHSYQVKRVIEHIPRDRDSQLNFDAMDDAE